MMKEKNDCAQAKHEKVIVAFDFKNNIIDYQLEV